MSVTHDEVMRVLETQGAAWKSWQSRLDADVNALAGTVADLQLQAQRPRGIGGASGARRVDTAEHQALEAGFRSLIAGDQAGAAAHFSEIQRKGMNSTSDPDGGYLDSPMLANSMLTIMLETAPILSKVRTVQMTHGTVFEEPIDRDSAEAAWTSERSARPETSAPELGKLSVPLHEIYSLPGVSQTLIDQADIDVVAWLTRKIAEQFAAKEADAVFNGDGVGKPRGFLTLDRSSAADSSREWGSLQYIPSGKAASFASVAPADKLLTVVYSMKSQYLSNAAWAMNRGTAAAVRQLKSGSGDYAWQPSGQAGQPDRLFGYPVILAEEMPAVASNACAIAFGNFERGYTRVERPGIKLLVDPYTSKPDVLLYCYRRTGGRPANSEAIKLLKFSVS